MKINLTENAAPTPVPAGNIRQPLGRRNPATVAATVRRVTGNTTTAPAVDVAAFQSFAD